MTVFPRVRPTGAWLMVLMALLLLPQSPLFGQETTGIVSGTVLDATGAVIPHATVVLTNLANKSERKTVSGGDGDFTIPSVASDLQYQVTVSMQGFKSWVSKPFPIRPGDRINFTDIKLQIGAAEAQVTVEATESQAVKPLDTPERSDVITAKDLDTLAIVGRDATELIETLPGFAMISPGVNNTSSANTAAVSLNNGITGGFSPNGTGPTGLAVVLDGVSLTDIQTNSGTVQTVDADMIQSAKVTTSTYSAANAKGPAVFNAITKAGTTSYHGGLYLYARDTALNSNDWDNNYLEQTRPDGRYFFPGGWIGGPLWIPGTRFTRSNNKLFFFFGFEYINQLFSPQTLDTWVPTMAERAGDFSVANLNAQLCGSRPDGGTNFNATQPMCYAENFANSGTSGWVNVVNGNVSQFADAGGVALLNWLPPPNADPFRNLSGYNYIQPVVQTQNGNLLHARVDYSINDNNKIYLAYGRQSQITAQPVSLGYVPAYSVLYPGGVTTGDISNIASATYTRVFGPTLTNELNGAISFISDPGNMGNPAAVDRFDMNSYNGGHGNFGYLGAYKQAGDYSVPALANYSGNLGYPALLMPGGFYANKVRMKKLVPDIQDSVSWMKGPHYFQFGIYFEKGILNGIGDSGAYPQGEYTFNPGTSGYAYNGNVGAPFYNSIFVYCENPQTTGTSRTSGASYLGSCINPNAMMYTGTPDSFQQTNFTPTVDMNYTTLAGYVNDQWKLKRVTLMLGARIEHLGPWTDRHGNGLATFSPSLYNSECTWVAGSNVSCAPTNDYPGIQWHGNTSSVSNSVNSPDTVYFTPRLGMSWDIFGRGNTVLRGGWGIYRHEEEFAPYALAAATAQGYKTTRIQNQYFTFTTVDEQAPINPSDYNINVLSPTDTVRPTYYEYNGTVSQRLNLRGVRNSLLEVAYVGGNFQNLSSFNQGNSYNEASDLNLLPAGVLFQGQGTHYCLCNLPPGPNYTSSGIGSLTTGGQDFFRPYPFYQHIYELKHNFYGNYNSLQVSWNKSSGMVQYGANYTFSKNLATAASYNNNLADPVNLRNDYGPSPQDRTHVFNVHYLVDLGKRYHGSNQIFSQLANGWQISGISTVQSGINLPAGEGANFGFGYGSIQPTQVWTLQQVIQTQITQCAQEYSTPKDKNGNQYCITQLNPTTWLGTPDYLLMPTLNCNPAGGSATHQFIKPTCFGVPLPGSPSTGQYALSANPSGQGVYRLPYIRGPFYQNHNLSVLKNFALGENKNLQIRAEGFNFLNHPLTSFNNSDNSNLNLGSLNYAVAGQPLATTMLRSPNFGIANIKYGSRLIELGAKFTF